MVGEGSSQFIQELGKETKGNIIKLGKIQNEDE
jgi:hypothetical protein